MTSALQCINLWFLLYFLLCALTQLHGYHLHEHPILKILCQHSASNSGFSNMRKVPSLSHWHLRKKRPVKWSRHVLQWPNKDCIVPIQSATFRRFFSPTKVGRSVFSVDRQRAAYVAQFPCPHFPAPSAFSPLRFSTVVQPSPLSSSVVSEIVVSLFHIWICWE